MLTTEKSYRMRQDDEQYMCEHLLAQMSVIHS